MTNTETTGVTIHNIFYTLSELENDCWLRLLNGSLKSRDAFHTAAVATLQQGAISLRTVVLRHVLPAKKQLRFHTDIRSPKWQELQQSNIISLLFYDAAARMQLRINGVATRHYGDAVAETAWQKTGLSSRRCYLAEAPPSSPAAFPTSGFDETYALRNPTEEESEAGKKHFGVVSIQAQSMDWLWLHHTGHRRAFFDYAKGENRWLVP
jgi:3-hydroxyisobutyrate dehydrogenase